MEGAGYRGEGRTTVIAHFDGLPCQFGGEIGIRGTEIEVELVTCDHIEADRECCGNGYDTICDLDFTLGQQRIALLDRKHHPVCRCSTGREVKGNCGLDQYRAGGRYGPGLLRRGQRVCRVEIQAIGRVHLQNIIALLILQAIDTIGSCVVGIWQQLDSCRIDGRIDKQTPFHHVLLRHGDIL